MLFSPARVNAYAINKSKIYCTYMDYDENIRHGVMNLNGGSKRRSDVVALDNKVKKTNASGYKVIIKEYDHATDPEYGFDYWKRKSILVTPKGKKIKLAKYEVDLYGNVKHFKLGK